MSSSLTIALAALGGVVLAGVVAQGAWQARKADPKKAVSPPVPRPEPREPVMGPSADPALSETVPGVLHHDGEPSGRLSPQLDDGELTIEGAGGRLLPRRVTPRVDALIDVIVPMMLDAPVTGDAVLSHLPGSRRAGSKPFFIEGLNAENGQWEPPLAGQRYGELQAGLQLANRTGALNEIEYSEFVQKLQAFSEAIGAMADFPDMLDVAARARELDAFAGEHDAQMSVQLRARSAAWSVGYLVQQASRHGFVPGVLPGRLVLPSAEDGAPPVLTLIFDSQAALSDDPSAAALRELALGFDVSQTDPAGAPFAAWQASALGLSKDLDADIVDDRGQPLTQEGFAFIDGELVRLYGALQEHDLAAGSAAARRLFS
ncbi:MAG: cell division protein FtsZ [Pseudomonadota bacterium]|nr:cell division protein FtsZ [Pseudomonadota bacterium]